MKTFSGQVRSAFLTHIALLDWGYPATPSAYGDRLASRLALSLHIVIPEASHEFGGVWTNCLDDLVALFFSQGVADGLDASCVGVNKRPAFVSWRDDGTVPTELKSPIR